jgi:predicted alpha-1,2-mannosidase
VAFDAAFPYPDAMQTPRLVGQPLRHLVLALGFAAMGVVGAGALSARPATQTAATPPSGPADFVNLLIGTSNGGNTVPGAVLPFGMLNWGPEEVTPDPARGPDAMRAAAAGGYKYEATRVRGFSLTHLSGTGCRGASGDIPFMPIAGEVKTSPSADAKNEIYGADFDHANEAAKAGTYSVRLASGVQVDLAAAMRAGLGRFTYPAGQPATLLIRASDSQVGSSDAKVTVDPETRTIFGSVTSGNFCGYLGTVNRRSYYTLYFVAQFNAPFKSFGTWTNDVVTPGGTTAAGGTTYGKDGYPAPGLGSGAYVTFDRPSASSGGDPAGAISVRVGISYVSLANANANMGAELEKPASFGLRYLGLAMRARAAWNKALSAIQITSGTSSERTIFYTALYHAMMHMNVFSDENGDYWGFDQQVHKVAAPQKAQYANFSGWDVYRSQLQLVTLLDPQMGADMAQSLFNQANQNHGEWDRWTHNTGGTHVMEGDAAAEAVPSILAFGGTNFDMKGAFASLRKAATDITATDQSKEGCGVACPGQRPSLDKWLTLHYIPTQSNAWGGAGETLEDVSADFALAQMARRLGDETNDAAFMARSDYWRNVFNPKPVIIAGRGRGRGDAAGAAGSGAAPPAPEQPYPGGYIQNRNEDGTWPPLDPSGTNGFAEASSVVYTWMIPFNPRGLFEAMGGLDIASERLDRFFHTPDGKLAVTRAGGLHAEMNNEPSIGTPWLYLFAGYPDKAQQTIRETIKVLWKDTPPGIPGNDDLGAMSAWFVWASMGMHPLAPGRGELLLASPLFPRIVITRANGKTITMTAPGANMDTFYVQSLKVNGQPSTKAWLPESFIANGGTLEYVLGALGNRAWGSKPADAPPSFGPVK